MSGLDFLNLFLQLILSMGNLGRLHRNNICIQNSGIMLNLLIHFHSKVQITRFE